MGYHQLYFFGSFPFLVGSPTAILDIRLFAAFTLIFVTSAQLAANT